MEEFIMSLSAIVLAGGFGTRMGGMCDNTPKSMLRFNERPFLEYLVSWLLRVGVSEVIISTGFLSENIEMYFGTDAWNMVRIVRENQPLGTGGAVRFAAMHTSHETLFLCNADTLVEFNFPIVHSLATMLGTPMVAVVTLNESVPNQGAIKVEQGVVTEFREDGIARSLEDDGHSFRASSTGCYFVKKSLLLSENCQFGASLEKEILPYLVERRLVGAVSCGTGLFLDYGTLERYALLKNNPWMLERVYGSSSER